MHMADPDSRNREPLSELTAVDLGHVKGAKLCRGAV